jgi:capsular polysaccharide biosynthesis protein
MPTSSDLTETEIAPYQAGPARLITATSYLIDRFVPDCEIVALPAKTVAGGVLRFSPGPFVPRPAPKGFKARLKQPRRTSRPLSGAVFDFRLRDPENWAHFINNHLPIFFRIADLMGLDWGQARLVVPADIPPYIRAAADLFGLTLIATDDDLDGDGIRFDATPWTGVRGERAAWVRSARVRAALDPVFARAGPLPRRVFLARRGTRYIQNQAEVEDFIAGFGFVTLYPEDLSAADQFALFHQAETLLAIHGAALAPLLYRPPDSRLCQVIEILPCGHMTDVYRVMAQQAGCAWIGVRGRIKPDYVLPAYDLQAPFRAFSLDGFDVDIPALDRAFRLAEHPVEK